MMLGAISTARKSALLFGRFGLVIDVGFFAGCRREILASNSFSTLITTAFR
jgi:hypothetical protein